MMRRLELAFILVLIASCSGAGSPPPTPPDTASNQIDVQTAAPTSPPTLGQQYPDCNVFDGDLLLYVRATCVVDKNQRIVVTDLQSLAGVFDTLEHPGLLKDNIPTSGYLPLTLKIPNLQQAQPRLLLIQVQGDCGKEHAAGSVECSVPSKP